MLQEIEGNASQDQMLVRCLPNYTKVAFNAVPNELMQQSVQEEICTETS